MDIARQCTSGKLPVRGMEIVAFLLLLAAVVVVMLRVFFFFLWWDLDVDDGDGVEEPCSSLRENSDLYTVFSPTNESASSS
jgi:hypothetical protein